MRYFVFIFVVVGLSACGEKPDTQAAKAEADALKGQCNKVLTFDEIRRGEKCK